MGAFHEIFSTKILYAILIPPTLVTSPTYKVP